MKIEFTEEQSFDVLTEYAEKKLENMSEKEQIKLLCGHAYALLETVRVLIDSIAEVIDNPDVQTEALRQAFVGTMKGFDYDAISKEALAHQLHVAVHYHFPMDDDEFYLACFTKAVEEA